MFKMMEQGQLLAAEIFPAVAREMAKVANVAGALDEKMKTTRVAQGRFFNQLEIAMGRTIFEAGFDRGGFEFFNQLALSLNESTDGLEGIGKTFRLVLKILSGAVKIATPILNSFFFVLGETAETIEKLFGSGIGKILMGVGALAAGISTLNTRLGRTFFMFLGVLGIIDEIYALFTKGRVGVVEAIMGEDLALLSEDNPLNNTLKGILATLTAIAFAVWPLIIVGKIFKGLMSGAKKVIGGGGNNKEGGRKPIGRGGPVSSGGPSGGFAEAVRGSNAAKMFGRGVSRGAPIGYILSEEQIVARLKSSKGGDTTVTVPVKVINAEGMDEEKLGKAIKKEISTSLPEWSRRQALENSLGE